VLVAHREQAGLVGELGQQTGALHDDGLRHHDGAGHQPDEHDALARALSRALEHQRVANGVPAVLGDAAQGQHRHGHGNGLETVDRRARREGLYLLSSVQVGEEGMNLS